MNKSGFNKRELELIENIQAAESYVSGDNDLEMDFYNNSFRMFFTDNGELTFPVDYNSTTKKFNINGNADTIDVNTPAVM